MSDRLHIAAVLGRTVVVAATVALLWWSAARPVTVITIAGTLTDAERAEAAATVHEHLPSSLVAVNVASLQAALLALPWSDRVAVRRIPPAKLAVSIAKPTPVANWAGGGLVTSRGVVVPADPLPGLPSLHTHLATPERGLQVLVLARQVLAATGLEVVALEESPIGEWRLQLADGLIVRLGTADLEARVRRAVAAFRSHDLQPRDVAYLDARYDLGVAVGWRPASQRALETASDKTTADKPAPGSTTLSDERLALGPGVTRTINGATASMPAELR